MTSLLRAPFEGDIPPRLHLGGRRKFTGSLPGEAFSAVSVRFEENVAIPRFDGSPAVIQYGIHESTEDAEGALGDYLADLRDARVHGWV